MNQKRLETDKIMNIRLPQIVANKKYIITLYLILALGASIQLLTTGNKRYTEGGREYNKYNNYTIFEKSFDHLINNRDLYAFYPDEYWDLYKYTPTFSVFFGFFHLFPDRIGLTLWNIINAFTLVFALYYLPRLSNLQKGWILLILTVETMTSLQNAQSNALMAGLLVLAFGLLEREKYAAATFFIVFSAYIKLFGMVGFVLFLFYPKKWKLALYSFVWSVVLFLIPLIFVGYKQYLSLLESYFGLLTHDYSDSYGYSVMGWLHSWFGIEVNKSLVVLTGAVVLLLPLIQYDKYKQFLFRYYTLSSLLIWVVIFNHKAESPTFIIAMTGVALWFIKSRMNATAIILFALAVVLTSLSPTDIFPRYLRQAYVQPFALKAFPCILIWGNIIYTLMILKEEQP